MGKSRSITGNDKRGNSETRRRRRQYLVDTYGDGTTVKCHLEVSPKCLGLLDVTSVSPDRHPIPGRDGGSYRRENIRPSCVPCQCYQGGKGI